MSTSRTRLAASTAAALAAALVLSSCGGSKSDDGSAAAADSCVDTSGDTIKLGFLNSTSGAMAISEQTVRDSLLLAAKEINADGGILGKQIEPVEEDGASDPAVFAEKIGKLLTSDCVAAVFGGWTSASRKAMLPVVEGSNGLLFYPVQYEGLEASENIYYTGATTNQQIIPAMDFLASKGVKTLFLAGSDYVFPRTANKIIKQYAAELGIEIVGEEYVPLDSDDWSTQVAKIVKAKPDFVFNTINGSSNVGFIKAYYEQGLGPDTSPIISVSIAEEEAPAMGKDVTGQFAAWNYFQSVETPANEAFIEAFQAEYGADRPTSDPMEAAYTSLYLYKNIVEKAESFDVDDVNAASDGVSFDAPEGTVTIDGENHHIAKTGLIGRINAENQFDVVWSSEGPIEPDPFLEGYDWWDPSAE
ncbi:urea ABC transporter substrate-binding protein [Nocardioides sp. SOB77]|uniref:Urea ABC transporter substrate-binding protein n=1 Tax=Nocardioides oceani TaxID=3058369 RepID=A0ABT8FFJ2_9ACTN|nr:urea ABC transporter substrate-binding protein [Nocardioides oceani]MDN4173162.1 urea ABC transporter substrate-binding protein [Nocardioides oceani]